MKKDLNEIFASEDTLAVLENKLKAFEFESKKTQVRLKEGLHKSKQGSNERRIYADLIVDNMLIRYEIPEYKRIKSAIESMKRYLNLIKQDRKELDVEGAKNIDITEVVQNYGIELKRGKGLCPFHSEKNPSFSIDKKRNKYNCFGCGEHGDTINFVMRMENLTFVEAVKKLM